jgi:hypothetical protein
MNMSASTSGLPPIRLLQLGDQFAAHPRACGSSSDAEASNTEPYARRAPPDEHAHAGAIRCGHRKPHFTPRSLNRSWIYHAVNQK